MTESARGTVAVEREGASVVRNEPTDAPAGGCTSRAHGATKAKSAQRAFDESEQNEAKLGHGSHRPSRAVESAKRTHGVTGASPRCNSPWVSYHSPPPRRG